VSMDPATARARAFLSAEKCLEEMREPMRRLQAAGVQPITDAVLALLSARDEVQRALREAKARWEKVMG
jgi:hypothetical protein